MYPEFRVIAIYESHAGASWQIAEVFTEEDAAGEVGMSTPLASTLGLERW